MPKPDALGSYAPVFRTEAIRCLDQAFARLEGLSEYELMHRAAGAAYNAIIDAWPDAGTVAVFCGSGGNGGDGWVLARLLNDAGVDCQVFLLGDVARIQGAAREAMDEWRFGFRDTDRPVSLASNFCEQCVWQFDVLVDAIAGIGQSHKPRPEAERLIKLINKIELPVVSLDVPTGVDPDTGAVIGEGIKADLTVTFIAHKPGLLTGAALNHVGRLVLADLGAPAVVFESVLVDGYRISADAAGVLPARSANAHKGHFGHVLVIGGNRGMGGAALLAAGAALRSGAGLVSLATRSEHITAALARHPELMVTAFDDAAVLPELCEDKSVIVIGPGLGQDDWAQQSLRQAVAAGVPLVCDADALNLIAANEVTIPPEIPLIVTPHPGEASRLAGVTISEIEADRVRWARELAERIAGVVVLKGAGTVVASPFEDDPLTICSGGNPGMATGGMGDVLGGLIGALVAQGMSLMEASALGVAVHAGAGDLAWERYGVGLTASDVADGLGVVLSCTGSSA